MRLTLKEKIAVNIETDDKNYTFSINPYSILSQSIATDIVSSISMMSKADKDNPPTIDTIENFNNHIFEDVDKLLNGGLTEIVGDKAVDTFELSSIAIDIAKNILESTRAKKINEALDEEIE